MKVALLLSGGVDSSVALHLLKNEGVEDITAFYLKVWLEDELKSIGNCPWEEDLQYARSVTEMAGIPLEIVSLQKEYYQNIVEYVISELRVGRTPSPDILCNQRIKFGDFVKKIDSSYEKVATGHYAQIEVRQDQYWLKRSPDPVKDQTYFLHHLNQEQLKKALFPIGHLKKNQIRELACDFNLANKDRKDSQGICFLGKIKYPEFIKYHLGEKKGAIINHHNGSELGEHKGYWFYTIGQRQGLGLGGGPWFVVKKDVEQNILFVAHEENVESQNQFMISNLHWISEPPKTCSLQVKIRHTPLMEDCEIVNISKNRLKITLTNKDQGIAPGQSAILYDGDYCLGGGVIE